MSKNCITTNEYIEVYKTVNRGIILVIKVIKLNKDLCWLYFGRVEGCSSKYGDGQYSLIRRICIDTLKNGNLITQDKVETYTRFINGLNDIHGIKKNVYMGGLTKEDWLDFRAILKEKKHTIEFYVGVMLLDYLNDIPFLVGYSQLLIEYDVFKYEECLSCSDVKMKEVDSWDREELRDLGNEIIDKGLVHSFYDEKYVAFRKYLYYNIFANK